MSKSRSLNKVTLIGNLTRDPVIRESSSGVLVCTFGVATNTSWKDEAGESKERAEFHNIVAFNKLAEICAQVLSTGMLVYVEGELRTRVKETSTGEKYHKTEVKLNDMLLLNPKDKAPVGLEAAKKAGNDILEAHGEEQMPKPEPDDAVDDLDTKQLF